MTAANTGPPNGGGPDAIQDAGPDHQSAAPTTDTLKPTAPRPTPPPLSYDAVPLGKDHWKQRMVVFGEVGAAIAAGVPFGDDARENTRLILEWAATPKRRANGSAWSPNGADVADGLGVGDRIKAEVDPPPTPTLSAVPSAPPGEIDARQRAYAEGVLRSEAEELARTANGRNGQLNVAAFTCSPFVNTGALTREEVEDLLTDAARVASGLGDHPLTDNEIAATLRSGLDSGAAAGLTRYAPDDGIVVKVERGPLVNGEGGAAEAIGPAVDHVENAIQQRLSVLRIDQEARRRLDDETRPPVTAPAVKSLDALLAEPDSPTRYRIERVAPAGSRLMLSAQYKAGKTTLVGNLARSLADSEPFLGRFAVHAPARRLVLIDNEMSEDTLRAWLREQRITNTAAVADVISLRGKVAAFNLLDDRRRDQWARRLGDLGCDYLVLDCLRPVLDALGLDENHDAGTFLVAFDELLAEAGVADSLTVQHMGHANERARGDSRLQDWPDALWRVARASDDPGSARYFSAYGRDVEVAEGRLAFDSAGRRLVFNEGSRADVRTEAAFATVLQTLAAAPGNDGLSGSAIESAVSGEHTRQSVRDAVGKAVQRGLVVIEPGSHGARLHRIAHPCTGCGMPVTAGRERHESCAPGESLS